MLELETTHSHLYLGARGRVVAGDATDGPVTLVFADGVRVAAALSGDRLRVAAHQTARGTAIRKKVWIIEIAERTFRIRSRAG